MRMAITGDQRAKLEMTGPVMLRVTYIVTDGRDAVDAHKDSGVDGFS